jgi:hypothetical protein
MLGITPILKSRIPQIIAAIPDELGGAMEEHANRVSEGAKDRVHSSGREGGLRDAIHVEQGTLDDPNDALTWRVVAGDEDVYYGHIEEHGSVNRAPHPFLTPAAEADRQRFEDEAGEALGEV